MRKFFKIRTKEMNRQDPKRRQDRQAEKKVLFQLVLGVLGGLWRLGG
jgi:hypothetical protein